MFSDNGIIFDLGVKNFDIDLKELKWLAVTLKSLVWVDDCQKDLCYGKDCIAEVQLHKK